MKITNVNDIIPHFIVIEKQVLADPRLSDSEKILYCYISALTCNKKSSCFASNKYLSNLMNVCDRQIRNYLSSLKKYDYIKIKISNGNKRIITTTLNDFMEKREKFYNQDLEKIFSYNWLDESEEE